EHLGREGALFGQALAGGERNARPEPKAPLDDEGHLGLRRPPGADLGAEQEGGEVPGEHGHAPAGASWTTCSVATSSSGSASSPSSSSSSSSSSSPGSPIWISSPESLFFTKLQTFSRPVSAFFAA